MGNPLENRAITLLFLPLIRMNNSVKNTAAVYDKRKGMEIKYRKEFNFYVK